MGENTYSVYMHRNKKNGKVYIGITCRDVKIRWGNNGNGYKPYYGHINYFWNSIEKNGWDGFYHYVIQSNMSKEDAENMEIRLIKYYDSTNPTKGYNIQNGGSSHGCHNIKTREYLSEIQKKIVYQYNRKTGALIDVFESTIDAEYKLGAANSNISAVCLGKVKTAYDFYFSYTYYENGVPEEILKWINKNEWIVKVAQYDMDGNFIKLFNSKADANESMSGNRKKRISFKGLSSYGYIWKEIYDYNDNSYTNKLSDEELSNHRKHIINNRICYQYDLNGRFITQHMSTTSAAKSIGRSQTSIASACRNHNKSCGYYWRYNDEIEYGKNLPKEDLLEIKPGLCLMKAITQYDSYGNIVNTFPSVTDAARKINGDTSCLSLCCKRKIKQAYGFIWRYEHDILSEDDLKWCLSSIRLHNVIQLDLNEKFIASFKNVQEVSKIMNIDDCSLYKAIKENKPVHGYIWKYA